MKVYVDELPNSCHNCCFECDSFCCINRSYVIDNYFENTKHKDCPLKSLADYTKQVRKEVADEIKSALRKNVAKMMGYRHCYPESAIYWDEVVTILEKIGEEEC